MSLFHLEEEIVDQDASVIALAGYVDFDATLALKRSLTHQIEQGRSHLVIDLSQTGFLDSTAIGLLVGTLKRLRESGGSLELVCTTNRIRNIFEIVGLADLTTMHASRNEAISALARAS